MTAILKGNVLTLTGAVGERYFLEDNFSHSQVVRALAEVEDAAPLTVHLNSGGGGYEEGVGIYNALRARSGTTHIIVHGLAASAGSFIAMAGSRISMAAGSIMMMHEVMVSSQNSTGAELEHLARIQETMTTASAKIYAARSKRSLADVRKFLKAETWWDADETVKNGFADDVQTAARHDAASAFPYQTYRHAPAELVNMALTNKWTFPEASKEKSMTDAPSPELLAQATKAATARIKTIMGSSEAKGRTDLAEHIAYETDMSAEAGIAMLAKAARPSEEVSDRELFENRRFNGEGLNGPGGGPRASVSSRVDIVAAMRRRHGIKE